MLRSLKDLFDRLAPPAAPAGLRDEEHLLQLAAAVMLVEVMRADASLHDDERAAVFEALVDKFALAGDEAQRLVDLAHATAKQATDLFAFTSRINERFEMAQKIRMIEHMWRVAYADAHKDKHEEHLVRKVADLLHLSEVDFAYTRHKVEEEMKK